jgi:hypothetical protein
LRDNWRISVVKATAYPGLADFIKKNHYLKSLARGVYFTVLLLDGDTLIGAACFGHPVGMRCKDIYSPEAEMVELKRFVLKDCPKNTASWMMARSINWIKRNTPYRTILTYADPNAGHEGIIYKASNFRYLGKQKYPNPMYRIKGQRKLIHGRAAFQKGSSTALIVRKGLRDGTVKRVNQKPKHIFVYKLAA